MFDLFKGGKAFLTLRLDHPLEFYYFGETVHGSLTVENDKELKVQEGRIVLLYKEEYEHRRQHVSHDSHGRTHSSQVKAWQSHDCETNRVVFLQEGTLAANSRQTVEFDLGIPANAAPTAAGGRIVRLKWLVRATLDRKMAADFNNEVEIFVSAVPRGDSQPGEYGNSNEPGEAGLALALAGTETVLGSTIEGEFVVRPQKSFDVTEIRVELVRAETVPSGLGNQAHEEQKVALSGNVRLEAGQPVRLPFRVAVPNPRPPSCRTEHYAVDWSLRGVLARRLRSDTLVEQPILVHNTLARAAQ